MAEPKSAVADTDTDPYVAGLQEGRLLLQHCAHCGRWQFYPRSHCRYCHAPEPAFEPASGLGTVHSFTIVRRPPSRAFADRVPYAVALVELAEGPRVMTNVVDCPVEDVAIGLDVTLTFPQADGGEPLPCFRPAATREEPS